jgi:hypothetical protein
MRMQIQSVAPRYHPALGATDEQITAAAGTVGAFIPVAGPFIAAAASIAITIEKLFSGCGATCTQATSIANQVAALLTTNVQNYVNSPVRTVSMQSAAISTFQSAWSQLVSACSNSALGQAGQNCISERQQGGCQWKTSPGGWVQNADGTCTYTWAGAAGSGATCWNWFVGFLDPIQNDPCVISDEAVATGTAAGSVAGTGTGTAAGSTSSTTMSNILPILLLAGAGLLIFSEAGL